MLHLRIGRNQIIFEEKNKDFMPRTSHLNRNKTKRIGCFVLLIKFIKKSMPLFRLKLNVEKLTK